MIGRLERLVIRLLRLPPPPQIVEQAPAGSRILTAAPGYYRMQLLRWLFGQISAAIGIALFLTFTGSWDLGFVGRIFDEVSKEADIPRWLTSDWMLGYSLWDGLYWLELLGIVGFVLQLPISLLMVGLDYRSRWYVLTDRSLHIRAGVRNVKEQTLTFANIQNVKLEQGPIERLFGCADVKVHTAGGGAGSDDGDSDSSKKEHDELHVGWLRGLSAADEARDLIIGAVRRYRDAGLGRTEHKIPSAVTPSTRPDDAATVAAAATLLQEVRAWRREHHATS